jgi:hypothetical protein
MAEEAKPAPKVEKKKEKALYKEILPSDVKSARSFLNQLCDVLQEDISASVSRRKYQTFVTGGVVGFAAFASVLISAQLEALPIVYLAILGAFILVEVIVWISFGLRLGVSHTQSQGKEFVLFILVSFVGLIINSAVVWLMSQYIVDKGFLSTSPDLIKNVAKIFATGLSLIWNFLGYIAFPTLGWFIHILLVAAIVIFLIRIIQGRNPV